MHICITSYQLNVYFIYRILELNKGQLARLADSSATGQYNDTNVLVTVVNKQKSPPASFLPLTVIRQNNLNELNRFLPNSNFRIK